MRQQALPVLVLCVVLLAGCSAVTPGGNGSTESPTSTPVETATATETATDTETWTAGGTGAMGPDSDLVELSVAENFSGTVEMDGTCLDDARTVGAGATVIVEREEPGGTCSFTVRVNGTVAVEDDVADYETAIVEVAAEGTVDVSTLAT